MGVVYKLPLTPQQVWNSNVYEKLYELWQTLIVGSPNDVISIIRGTYTPHGGDGEGELNGVPTAADVENIILGTYEPREIEIDKYGIPFDEVPAENEIDAIIAGSYTPSIETGDDFVIGDNDDDEYFYYDADEEYIDEQDILDIINGTYN